MKLFRLDWILSALLHLVILGIALYCANTATVAVPLKIVVKPPQAIIQATLVDKQQLDREVQHLLQQEKNKRQQQIAKANKLAKQQKKLVIDQRALKQAKQQLQSAQTSLQKATQQLQQEKQQAIKIAAAATQQLQQEKQRVIKIAAAAKEQERQLKVKQQNILAAELQRAKQSFKHQVQQHWIRPYGLDQNLQCGFEIYLNKTGTITAVMIFESSGNSAFDALARKAIYKASPLHSLPTHPAVLEKLQHFRFIFEDK